ncbi:hypothetical protein CLU79DRAFT_751292 [Phycomyces nitens]|nr:hypothetical protein CLU79DRAFT_751292 [Phycomyces nitens]
MDLSWCIICDNRVEDTMSEQSSLYCSSACRINDQSTQQTTSPVAAVRTKKITSAIQLLRTKRPAGPSNGYPWVPLYRRRHGVLIARRCQPVVAGSPVVASAHLSHRPSMVLS